MIYKNVFDYILCYMYMSYQIKLWNFTLPILAVTPPWYTLPYNSFLRRWFMFIKLFTFTSMCVCVFFHFIKILIPHHEDEFHLMSTLNNVSSLIVTFCSRSLLIWNTKVTLLHKLLDFNMKTIYVWVCVMNKTIKVWGPPP